MREHVQQVSTARGYVSYSINGILLYTVDDADQGTSFVKQALYAAIDTKTVLYLSGGTTPKPLYVALAQEEKLVPGAVGFIDERYGEPMHERSNERMIVETGLLRYFSFLDIPYYPMLTGASIDKTAQGYDDSVRSLQAVYPKAVGIIGMGRDGHIAGIAPNRADFRNPLFHKDRQYEMVSWFDDSHGPFKQRITQTFLGLAMLDLLIVMVFGAEKKSMLEQLFIHGSEEEVPARFLTRKSIAAKTILITDQQV